MALGEENHAEDIWVKYRCYDTESQFTVLIKISMFNLSYNNENRLIDFGWLISG